MCNSSIDFVNIYGIIYNSKIILEFIFYISSLMLIIEINFFLLKTSYFNDKCEDIYMLKTKKAFTACKIVNL